MQPIESREQLIAILRGLTRTSQRDRLHREWIMAADPRQRKIVEEAADDLGLDIRETREPRAVMPSMAPISGADGLYRAGRDRGHSGFPFYGVLLYTQEPGRDEALQRYVHRSWRSLDRMTGDAALVFALEDVDELETGSKSLAREEAYDIARMLGARVDDLPCLIIFTDPDRRNDVLLVRLERLYDHNDPSELPKFFRRLSTLFEAAAHVGPSQRLGALEVALQREWPDPEVAPSDQLAAVAKTTADGKTIFDAAASLAGLIDKASRFLS